MGLAQTERELTESRIAAMMSRIRTHFIFNTLGAISGYCKIDPAKADEMLTRFARHLRRNMQYIEGKTGFCSTPRSGRSRITSCWNRCASPTESNLAGIWKLRIFKIPPLTVRPLVDRGKVGITKNEALTFMGDGQQPGDSTYWSRLFRLKNIPEEAGVPSLLVTQGNIRYLDVEQVDCNLYRMRAGDPEAIAQYTGQYLRRYTWVEERIAEPEDIRKKYEKICEPTNKNSPLWQVIRPKQTAFCLQRVKTDPTCCPDRFPPARSGGTPVLSGSTAEIPARRHCPDRVPQS